MELLSKPDGDYVYPKFQFVVNELRRKYPEVYTSVLDNVRFLHNLVVQLIANNRNWELIRYYIFFLNDY